MNCSSRSNTGPLFVSTPRAALISLLPFRLLQVDTRWSKSEPLGRSGRDSGVIKALEIKKPLAEEAPCLPKEGTTTVIADTVGGFDRRGWISPNQSVSAGFIDNADIKPQGSQPTRLSGDLLETPESPTPGLKRPIPAPLDLTAVAGPITRPIRNLPDPKPVVLNPTALNNLRRLGGPSSSVSSFESRGSGVPGIVLVERDTARGDGSGSSGDASAGSKSSKGMGAGTLCGEVAQTTAMAAPAAAGRTFQVIISSISYDGNTVAHIDRYFVLMAWSVVDACFPHVLLRN